MNTPSALVKRQGNPAPRLVSKLVLAEPTQAPSTPSPKPISKTNAPPQGNGETIQPAPTKLTSADRQRFQDWVQKQLPALEKQLPDLITKLWALVKTSVGGFLGVTGFLLSLVMVPIYSFFLLKERPAIERRWREYLPLRNSPSKTKSRTLFRRSTATSSLTFAVSFWFAWLTAFSSAWRSPSLV